MKHFIKLGTLVLFITLVAAASAWAQTSIIGKWKTIDDETNEPKSIVQIFEKDGKYYGKIVKLFRKPGEDPNPICDDCKDDDDRKNQPITGMEIIRDLEKGGDKYKDGTILDPKDGKIYDCKLWVEDGTLKVRGYIAFFYRTQTWHPVAE
ncbi:MAG TPA: DUF2147 domain-containing protein [Desulfobacteraceae bacterium]|nr:DUF2147 domain-containing protein [Desulfobacteraceae bacterium]|tara:strand:+ start:937 stop:1386 length:450 start_codon:yes stop_codon:yes gene_type:complete